MKQTIQNQSTESFVGELLRNSGLKLATAESCTGGLIGQKITSIPGSSDYFVGGVIAYANMAKVKLIGVNLRTLREYGAVSQETVREMARGVRQVLDADIGLAVSGIAGPSGGTPQKPVGTVWIGLSVSEADQAWEYHFAGDRHAVNEQAVDKALGLLFDYLQQKEPLSWTKKG